MNVLDALAEATQSLLMHARRFPESPWSVGEAPHEGRGEAIAIDLSQGPACNCLLGLSSTLRKGGACHTIGFGGLFGLAAVVEKPTLHRGRTTQIYLQVQYTAFQALIIIQEVDPRVPLLSVFSLM
jgi:hypothetical protein